MQPNQLARRNAKTIQSSPDGKSICKIESKSAHRPPCSRSGALASPGISSGFACLKRHPSTKCNSTLQRSPDSTTIARPSTTTTNPLTLACRGPGRFVPRKTQLTSTLIEPSFHFLNKSNASAREIMFLWVANRFGFELAAFLATKFRWKLPRTLMELRKTPNEPGEGYTWRNAGTRRGAQWNARRKENQ